MVTLLVPAGLRLFLRPGRRREDVSCPIDATSTVGHVVQSMGVPLTEVGGLFLGDESVGAGHRLRGGEVVRLVEVARPQPAPTSPPRFVLDVHLGALARRMRLLGLDVAYRNDATDADLVSQSVEQQRVLLSRDRRLLQRRALPYGAYVRGDDPDAQLRDVVDRFAPPLHPWSRCLACNGSLGPVPKSDVEAELPPGTRRSYDEFFRCGGCGQVYWRGAHRRRLQAIVDAAIAFGQPATDQHPDSLVQA
jgi:uncharacterized protein with PIN domain